ncbi:MAG: hypothetical protein LBP79_07520, partial [Clostridiales bacterium]|jgi:hypothetical protein|nr:hypothetical protein [Clostridiales bacterium]
VRFDGSNLVFVRKADNFFIKKREKGERDFYFDELYSEHYRQTWFKNLTDVTLICNVQNSQWSCEDFMSMSE